MVFQDILDTAGQEEYRYVFELEVLRLKSMHSYIWRVQ